MKRTLFCLLATCLLCACTDEPMKSDVSSGADASVSMQEISEETEISCTHAFGDEPVEIVGNLYVYECSLCGKREVVPQGTLIGGEE